MKNDQLCPMEPEARAVIVQKAGDTIFGLTQAMGYRPGHLPEIIADLAGRVMASIVLPGNADADIVMAKLHDDIDDAMKHYAEMTKPASAPLAPMPGPDDTEIPW